VGLLASYSFAHTCMPPSPPSLLQEMFRQGDKEKSLGQPVSPLMDRTKGGVTKSQCGFFNIVALPLYKVGMHARKPIVLAHMLLTLSHLPNPSPTSINLPTGLQPGLP
jgi:hypothetical protein